MDSLTILLYNAILYTITLIVLYKLKGWSVGLITFGLFVVASWGSYLLWKQPQFRGTLHDNPQNPIALLYLYGMLLLTMYPLFNVNKLKVGVLKWKYENITFKIICCICFYQLFVFIIDFPQISNILNSTDLGNLRENVYDGSNSAIGKIPLLNRFNLIYSGLKPILVAFSVVLFFCYPRRRKLVTVFLITNILSIINEVVVMVSRGIIINYILYIGILLFYIRDYIDYKIRRILLIFCIVGFFVIFPFFGAISVSRFGDLANYMVYKYLGEAIINFGGIMYNDIQGSTYGRGYLLVPIFRDYITCEEKWEFVEGITKVNVSIFYTYIGELVVEFGKFGGIIAASILAMIQKHVFSQRFSVGSFFVLFIFIYSYSYGMFVFPIQGFMGFFFILFTILFYKLFKN